MESVWNGPIRFDLVSLSIKLFSVSEDRALDLDMSDSHDGFHIPKNESIIFKFRIHLAAKTIS